MQVLEAQWEIDLWVQKKKGWLEGWFRGFYKDYDYELEPKCFDRESVAMLYHLKRITSNLSIREWNRFQGLAFQLYFMFDHECTIDKALHDLSNFCFDHDCSGETLLQNEMSQVF